MGLFSAQPTVKQMASICFRLENMHRTGLPIRRAFQLLAEHTKHRSLRDTFIAVSDAIQQGASLGDAVRAQKGRLPLLFIEVVVNGERAGSLPAALKDLTEYYEEILHWWRSLLKYLWYPLVVMITAVFVIPLLRDVAVFAMDQGGGFDVILFLRTAGWPHLLTCLRIVTAILLLALLNRVGVMRPIWELCAAYGWPVTALTRPLSRAHYCRHLALLSGAGVPLRLALDGAARATVNRFHRRMLARVWPAIESGSTLHTALTKAFFLDGMTANMIETGEESGKLEWQLVKASRYNFEAASYIPRVWTCALGVAFYYGLFILPPIFWVADWLVNWLVYLLV
jgi:type II secretory pathway component PulF